MKTVICLMLSACLGCGATMNSYYRAVATAADAVTSADKLLQEHDKQMLGAIAGKAQTDPDGAAKLLAEYVEFYRKLRASLQHCSNFIAAMNAEGKKIEVMLKADREQTIRQKLATLAVITMDIGDILSSLGVTEPLGAMIIP